MSTTEFPATDISRVEREQEWHDRRFSSSFDRSSRLGKMTGAMTRDALNIAYHAAYERCRGARVLDYGCAEGEAAVLLRRAGAASVHGIDISPVAVQHAAARAAAENLSNVTFEVMNAEELTFPDAHFDFVFGIGILHHLTVSRAFAEIARVLTTHGSAVFLEPLAHNPFISAVRYLTPHARTADEHPLRMHDLHWARHHFNGVRERYVNLATLLSAPLSGLRGAERLHRSCATLDRHLLRVRWLSRFAWNVVLILDKPKLH